MVISGIRNVDIVGVAGSIPAAPTIPFPAKSIKSISKSDSRERLYSGTTGFG